MTFVGAQLFIRCLFKNPCSNAICVYVSNIAWTEKEKALRVPSRARKLSRRMGAPCVQITPELFSEGDEPAACANACVSYAAAQPRLRFRSRRCFEGRP